MFIAGVVVVGVVAAANHGDHSQHQRYSDKSLKKNIIDTEGSRDSYKAKYASQLKILKRYENNLAERFDEWLDELQKEFDLTDTEIRALKRKKENYQNDWNAFRRDVMGYVQQHLEKDLQKEQAQLNDIDALLVRINTMELQKK